MALSHLSYSSQNSFLQCGKAYQLEKVQKYPQTPAWYFVGGTAFHLATEVYDREAYANQTCVPPEQTDIHQLWVEALGRAADERPTDIPQHLWRTGGKRTKEWPNKADGAWWNHHGPIMLEDYIKWRHNTQYPMWDISGEPAIELHVTATLGDVLVKGAVDRIFVMDGQLTIVDLKAGSKEPSSGLQLAFYKHAVKQTFNMTPQWGYYYMARKGTLGEPHDLTAAQFDPAVVGAALSKTKRSIDSENFIPHVTDMCRTCGVRDACAAFGGVKAHVWDPDHPEYGRKP